MGRAEHEGKRLVADVDCNSEQRWARLEQQAQWEVRLSDGLRPEGQIIII